MLTSYVGGIKCLSTDKTQIRRNLNLADRIFENQKLAGIYDLLNSLDCPDLDLYINIVEEYKVQTVIDLGCGTGSFACKLAAVEKDVFAVDPAAASLNVAKRKNYANKVNWHHGTIAILPDLQADLITMTGNVAQVFLTDDDWISTLKGCRNLLKPGGRLVFEVRDPGSGLEKMATKKNQQGNKFTSW